MITVERARIKFCGLPSPIVDEEWDTPIQFDMDNQTVITRIGSDLLDQIAADRSAPRQLNVEGTLYQLGGPIHFLGPGADKTWTTSEIDGCESAQQLRELLTTRCWEAPPAPPEALPVDDPPATADGGFPWGRALLFVSITGASGGVTYLAINHQEKIHTWLNEKFDFDVRVRRVKARFIDAYNRIPSFSELRDKTKKYFNSKKQVVSHGRQDLSTPE